MQNLDKIANHAIYLDRRLTRSFVQDVGRSVFEDIWREELWTWRLAVGQITAVADYTTGYVLTLAQAGTSLTGDGTTWSAPMVGRHIRMSGDTRDYEIASFSSTTAVTIVDPYEGSSISTDTTYTIRQKNYRLPWDFDSAHVITNSDAATWVMYRDRANFQMDHPDASSQGTPTYVIEAGASTSSLYSVGTVTVTLNSTTFTGSGTTWDATRDTGRRFRVRGHPEAGDFKIVTVGGVTSITVDRAWPFPTKSGQEYDIDPPGEPLVELYPAPDANTSVKLWYHRKLQPVVREYEYPTALPDEYHDVWRDATVLKLSSLARGAQGVQEYSMALGELLGPLKKKDGISRRRTISSAPWGLSQRTSRTNLDSTFPAYRVGGGW